MIRRRSLPLLLLTAGALVAAMAAPAAAGSGGGSKPSATSMLAKGSRAAASASTVQRSAEGPGETDADEAENLRARDAFLQSITAAPAVVAPMNALVAARAAANHLPSYGGHWAEVTKKPFVNDPINRGANYGVGWGLVTGRMTAFTAAGRAVYAGSASGGVWRSYDQGATWREIDRGLPRLAIGALATDPRDGSVWVGTGEPNNSSEGQYGVGIYRLARGSDTWRRVGGTELFGNAVHRITWIKGYVYAATRWGLYRRSVHAPRSAHWLPVLQPDGLQKYPPSSEVTDVLAVPGSHGRQIFAVVGWAGYSNPPATQANGFYVGTGARGSFRKVTPTGDINPATIGRTTLSSSGGWLYAVVQDTSTLDLRGQGAYVSTSGRPTGPWTRIATVNKLAASGSALGDDTSDYYPGVQADYNQYILADPANRKHVYLQLEEVFESVDAGATWKAVGPYWNFDTPCNPSSTTPNLDCPPTTHPDQHAGMILNGQFWAGNDGGVWRRPVSWHDVGRWTNLNATIHTTQNYSIDVGKVPSGLAYWGGLQDNGESYTRPDMSTVEQAFTGDGGDTIVDPNNGDRAVEEYVYLDMYVTTDAATNTLREISPSCLTAAHPPAVCDPSPRFIAPIEKDVNNPDHWVAGGRYVWDDTKSWATVCSGATCDWKIAYDTGAGNSTTALAANGAVTYAGWCGGGCNPPTFSRGMATNYGGTWHTLSLAGLPNRYITSIAVDPKNAAHVYVSFGSYSRRWIPDAGVGHVFESTNGGASWRDLTGNLPDAPVFKVTLRGHQLIAGSEVGAFVLASGRHGSHWLRLGSGLPNVTVWDLVVAPNGRVEAGTHGRGDWELVMGRKDS